MQDSVQPESARAFAEQWIANWNRKDVEAVLKLFTDDVVFISSRAESIAGSSRVEGKAKLREYWTRAVGRIQTIHFSLEYVIREGQRLAIVYTSEINGKRMRTVEFLRFRGDGLICEGEAMHGVAL